VSTFGRNLAAEFAPFAMLSPEQLTLLDKHYELLVLWNERMNLTRIKSLEDVVRFHYCESLFLAKSLPPEPLRIVDVGSGAGFPGIPVAVFRPDCTVDLVESNQRKAVFLRLATSGLQNVNVLACRAETCQDVYDWIIARAVRPDQVQSYLLAPKASMLVSADDVKAVGGVISSQGLPWGRNRVIATFHVEQDRVDHDRI
jgi:16S rRNA (guanine(527)-N(7))-methyltransferase RsmG